MTRATSMLTAFVILYGCEGGPPPEPAAIEDVVEMPEPEWPDVTIPNEAKPLLLDPAEIATSMYELGRESVRVEQELADMERVVYAINCVERIAGGRVERDRELALLEQGRPSRTFRTCKKEILGLSQKEIHDAVFDEKTGKWRPFPDR